MSVFRARQGLFGEKAPTKKMGGLVVPQTHLKKVQNSGFFMSREVETGGARGD